MPDSHWVREALKKDGKRKGGVNAADLPTHRDMDSGGGRETSSLAAYQASAAEKCRYSIRRTCVSRCGIARDQASYSKLSNSIHRLVGNSRGK